LASDDLHEERDVTAADERPVDDLPTFDTTDPRTGEVLATLPEHDERLDHVLAV
jgi:hypothetical protein